MAIGKCTFFNGSVTIGEGAPKDIELKGIRSIRTIEATSVESLRSISSRSLESVDNIILTALPNLAFLNLSTLNILDSIRLENLPSIENCSLGLGPRTEAGVFNTSFQRIEWLKWPVTTTLNITENGNLESVSLPWETIDSNVTMKGNPTLDEISVVTVENVPGSFTLEGSDEVKELVFKSLESIDGDVNIVGAFNNVSMPTLRGVKGALKVQSSEDISGFCNSLVEDKLKGQFDCKANVQKEEPSVSKPTPPQESTNISPQSSDEPLGQHGQTEDSDMALGAKIGIILASLVLAIFVFVGVFFLVRARIRGKVMEIVPTVPGTPMVVPKPEKTVVITRLEGRTVRVVKINLNGQEIKEGEADDADKAVGQTNVGGKEIDREPSVRSVSSLGSVGSDVKMLGARSPTCPVSPV